MYTFPQELPTKYNQNYLFNDHYLWKNCGDDTIIQKFISTGESLDTMDARTGNSSDQNLGSSLNKETRISTVSWINYNDSTKELYDFFVDKIDRINYYFFGFKLTGVETFQYTRYPIGGHYIYHNDVIPWHENKIRKLSFVMSLSDPNEYEGGEFLLNAHGNVPTKFKFGKGDLIAFPSYIPHKVEPVTSGTRITLVAWAVGPKFT